MEKRTMEIIEEVSSQGIWTWLEFDNNSNSLYLEFKNFKLADVSISSPFEYKDGLVIRFGNNLFLSLFYNNVDDLNFLNFGREFDNIFYHNKKLNELDSPYFFTEFTKKLSNFKFQDYNLLKEIANNYKNKKVLVQNIKDGQNYDFLLILECENLAVAIGGDFINTFNDSEALSDDDIKRLSNKWILYYLDYWAKKGTEESYVKDSLCEEIPFNKIE